MFIFYYYILNYILNYIKFSFFIDLINRVTPIPPPHLSKKSKSVKLYIKDAYHPCITTKIVTNTVDLSNNKIITGPNAAGKTTLLKTTVINVLLSQQIGLGFYKGGKLSPFDFIHCYLNIPDTNARDSLFQAEARRCKEILESLEDGQKHFCIFDELFSGTNPTEACASSYGFIKYLIEQKNIDFILTTHLLDLCKKIESIVINSHMNVEKQNEYTFKYTYKISQGVSSVRGGLKVLYDLNYPEHILTESNNLLKNM